MNISDKCKTCTEPTKYITGHWDGRDKGGKRTHGVWYSCHSTTCPAAIEARKRGKEARREQDKVIAENKANGVDVPAMRVLRLKAEINLRKAAEMLGVSAPQYSDFEQQRVAMPKPLYDVWLGILNLAKVVAEEEHR